MAYGMLISGVGESPIHLFTYASGDGSLSFGTADHKNQSSRRPTEEELQRYITEFEDGKHLIGKGWKFLSEFNGYPHMVFPCERIGERAIRCMLYPEGHNNDYRYTYDDEEGKWSGGDFKDYALKIYSTHPDIGEFEVKNWSLRAVIRFWLSNEEQLTAALSQAATPKE